MWPFKLVTKPEAVWTEYFSQRIVKAKESMTIGNLKGQSHFEEKDVWLIKYDCEVSTNILVEYSPEYPRKQLRSDFCRENI